MSSDQCNRCGYNAKRLANDDSFFQKSVPTGKSNPKSPVNPSSPKIEKNVHSLGSSKMNNFQKINQSESISSKHKIQGMNCSEGKDSTKNFEIIRPIETLPLQGSNRYANMDSIDKISMIHEEAYPALVSGLTSRNLHIQENMQKTTNDNIKDYYDYKAKEWSRKSSFQSKKMVR